MSASNSGLARFLDAQGAQQTSADRRPPRQDRAFAQSLKFNNVSNARTSYLSTTRKLTNSRSDTHLPQQSSRNIPTPPSIDPRKTSFPKESLSDSSIDENWDHTLSEEHFTRELDAMSTLQEPDRSSEEDEIDEEGLEAPYSNPSAEQAEYIQEYDGAGDDDHQQRMHIEFEGQYRGELPVQAQTSFEARAAQALRRSNGSPTPKRQLRPSKQPPLSQGSVITGRFERLGSETIAIRPATHMHNEQPQIKRLRTPEDRDIIHRPQERRSEVGSAAPQYSEHEAESAQTSDIDEQTPRRVAGPKSNNHMTNEADNTTPANKTKHRIQPDHSEEEMRKISFSELNDSWDLGISLSDKRPLDERLREVIAQITLGKNDQEVAVDFFTKMSTAEWEDCGDWFVEEFAKIMHAMSAKRKERRVITAKYEDELRRREKSVRGKSEALDKKFRDMRASGEEVLRRNSKF